VPGYAVAAPARPGSYPIPVIARRGVPHGSGLGEYRYVVEQGIALLHWFRRL
jgi:hypothetical protein